MNWKMIILAIGLAAVFVVPKAASADDKKTDGEIIGLMMAADKDEIAAAKQAQSKSIRTPVDDYAKMLEKEHTDDLNKWEALSTNTGIKPPATAGTALRAKGTAMLAMLTLKNGIDYENGFLDAMIKDHTDDLSLIDNDLMKDVDNPQVKSQLSDTRTHVSAHLDKAKELQRNNNAQANK
jgi:putative membrane protein